LSKAGLPERWAGSLALWRKPATDKADLVRLAGKDSPFSGLDAGFSVFAVKPIRRPQAILRQADFKAIA
jgi:hypothetical protein